MFGVFLTLHAMVATIRALAQSPPAQADPAQIKSDLDRILADPEFHPALHQETWFTHMLRWLGDQWDAFWKWIGRLLDKLTGHVHLGGSGATGGGLQWMIIVLFLVGFLVLIAWLIRTLILHWKPSEKREKPAKTSFDIDEADADAVAEPDEWLRQAQQFAAAEDYRRAFRAVFLGILLRLDHAGAIQYDRARTNGDYLRILRGKGLGALYDAFRPLVFEFELRWYGNRATSLEDYQRCREAYDRIQDLIRSASIPAELAAAAGRA